MNDKNAYFRYLGELDDWGVTNMQEAAPYLVQQFPELTLDEARSVLHEYAATKFQLLNEAPRHGA